MTANRSEREIDYLRGFPFRDNTADLSQRCYVAESKGDPGTYIIVDKSSWVGWSVCWVSRSNQGEPMPFRSIWPLPGFLARWLGRKLSTGPDIGSGVKHTVRARQWEAEDRLMEAKLYGWRVK